MVSGGLHGQSSRLLVGGGGGCDTTSGASALGRTSAWGGLVMLSLVVSAAATML